MKKLDCPAVIIECGFLSNPAEEARLRDEAYHKQLAAAVICGYLRSQSDSNGGNMKQRQFFCAVTADMKVRNGTANVRPAAHGTP